MDPWAAMALGYQCPTSHKQKLSSHSSTSHSSCNIAVSEASEDSEDMSQRSKVISLYKQLIHLGKDYPKDPSSFQRKCHDAFTRNKDLSDPKEIEACISKGKYIVKELEAMYNLKKYRTLKRRYYDEKL
uniref:LYR motif-containing protein 5 n=1 Tax=Caligus rogercresseyi TaxID=217165 RepID=C1BR52_CALRO|nr:LYR motif-containing protein 5 [Caligus rogercresseyi]